MEGNKGTKQVEREDNPGNSHIGNKGKAGQQRKNRKDIELEDIEI